MRALAWWHTAPAPTEQEEKKGAKRPERLSRGAALRQQGKQPEMPEIEPEISYLVDTLMEAGPISVVGMGQVTLTWADLQAWEHGTGIELEPWEKRLLRQLSGEYLQETRRAEAADAVPPWIEDEDEIARTRREMNMKRVRDSMRRRAAKG